MDWTPERLEQLRARYGEGHGGDIFDPRFRRVADRIFSKSGTRLAPYAGVPTLLSAPYRAIDPVNPDFGDLQVALLGDIAKVRTEATPNPGRDRFTLAAQRLRAQLTRPGLSVDAPTAARVTGSASGARLGGVSFAAEGRFKCGKTKNVDSPRVERSDLHALLVADTYVAERVCGPEDFLHLGGQPAFAEPEIDKARAGNLHAADKGQGGKVAGHDLGDLEGSHVGRAGELQADGRGEIAHLFLLGVLHGNFGGEIERGQLPLLLGGLNGLADSLL